ncbi:hypothetical protein NQZ79_g5030 [Umbelopsis isabellina]|nr:hypothetical protein NQZ79_g5030 [Umbelopsis isabellina]
MKDSDPPSSPQLIFIGDSSESSHLSLSTTDAFSLNTFHELIDEHSKLLVDEKAEERRCLIIARVKTRDSSTERYFNSYYDAWHLNKILFRAQTSSNRSYIHRLSVADPMTNSKIVSVEYFKVGNDLEDEFRNQEEHYLEHKRINRYNHRAIQPAFDGCPKLITTFKSDEDNNLDDKKDYIESRQAAHSLSKVSAKNIPHFHSSHFIANYIGNDIDYMRSNALRTCFRTNAISVEDAELFLLQPQQPSNFLEERDWTRFLALDLSHQRIIQCSPVDALMQAVNILFCCVLYYVEIDEDEYGLDAEYGLEAQYHDDISDHASTNAETTAHDHWQPVTAVNDLTLTYSTIPE